MVREGHVQVSLELKEPGARCSRIIRCMEGGTEFRLSLRGRRFEVGLSCSGFQPSPFSRCTPETFTVYQTFVPTVISSAPRPCSHQ